MTVRITMFKTDTRMARLFILAFFTVYITVGALGMGARPLSINL